MSVDRGREWRWGLPVVVLCAGWWMMSVKLVAQDVPAPAELEMLLKGVKDARLREAMTHWQGMMEEVQAQHRLHLMTAKEVGAVFAEPGRLEPALELLRVAQEVAPHELEPLQVQGQLHGAVRAAAYSGRPEAVPVLEGLANSELKEIRMLVRDPDLYTETADPMLGVQRAALAKEAAELPVLRKGDEAAQRAWREFTGHLNAYVHHVPAGERMAVRPTMKVALQRTEGWQSWWWMKLEFDNMMMHTSVTTADLMRRAEEYRRFQGKTSWQREGGGVLWRVLAGLAVCGAAAGMGRWVVR